MGLARDQGGKLLSKNVITLGLIGPFAGPWAPQSPLSWEGQEVGFIPSPHFRPRRPRDCAYAIKQIWGGFACAEEFTQCGCLKRSTSF